jgi:hypothetical protein
MFLRKLVFDPGSMLGMWAGKTDPRLNALFSVYKTDLPTTIGRTLSFLRKRPYLSPGCAAEHKMLGGGSIHSIDKISTIS